MCYSGVVTFAMAHYIADLPTTKGWNINLDIYYSRKNGIAPFAYKVTSLPGDLTCCNSLNIRARIHVKYSLHFQDHTKIIIQHG